MNELDDIRSQMAKVSKTDFDSIFEELFNDFLSEQLTSIKNSIKAAVKQNPSLKTITHTILYAPNAPSKHVAYFDGHHSLSAKCYSVTPTTASPAPACMPTKHDYRTMSAGSAACCLSMDQLYRMEYRNGWLNKSYALVLTPLGERFVSSIMKLCKRNQINFSFDCYFSRWFKGSTITEAVRVGYPFSPRAIYEDNFDKFSLRLTAQIHF